MEASQTTIAVNGKTSILKKMAAVMEDVKYIQKDAKNLHFKFNYASEKAIKEAVYPSLRKHGVIFQLSQGIPIMFGSNMVVPHSYSFLDVQTGESLSGTFNGEGSDNQGKGVYIATTGAIKYLMTSIFGIVTGDDPERDEVKLSRTEEPRDRIIPPKQNVAESGKTSTPPQAVAGMNKQPLVDLINAMEGVMYSGDLERIQVIRDKQGIPKEAIETTGKNLKKYTDLLSQELDVKIGLGEGQVYKVKKAIDAARTKHMGAESIGKIGLQNVPIEKKLDYLIHMRAKKIEKEKAA